jgi:Uma2 family endonuclease
VAEGFFMVEFINQALGIQEYWIIDYLGLGGRTFIGYPKQPVISVYSLIDDEYNLQQFRGNDLIQSSTFPEVELSTAFGASGAIDANS